MAFRPKTLAFILIMLATGAPRAAEAREKIVKSLTLGETGLKLQVVCESRAKAQDRLSVRAVGKNAPAKLVLEDETSCRSDGDRYDVSYSARPFTLSPTLTGALIKQEAGGEAIAHSYWLVVAIDGKLTKLWDAMYSTQEMVSIDSYRLRTTDSDRNGRQEIDYAAPFPVSNDPDWTESADGWEHQLLEFDDAKKAMVEKPHQEFAAVLATTKTLKEALALKSNLLKDKKCQATDFLVLDTDSEVLPKLRKGFHIVASICESRADAQVKLDRIKTCRPEISGAIRQVR